MKLAVCDLTHLFIDEAEPLAEALGIGNEYGKLNGNLSSKTIRYYFNQYLAGKNVGWVAKQLKNTEPYSGAVKTIGILKENGYKVLAVTDDSLMSVPENNKIIMSKLKLDGIIPTSKIKVVDNIYRSLSEFVQKQEIIGGLINHHKPEKILGVVQGKNDIPMADYLRKTGATVIGVNSDSAELKNICHHHIESIAEAPELLEKIIRSQQQNIVK